MFNCHVCERATKLQSTFKPATKVAAASAVGANIITHKDNSAFELLGPEYPFYATSTLFDGLYRAKKAFGTEAWKDGLEIMESVRARTSLDAVADLYRWMM